MKYNMKDEDQEHVNRIAKQNKKMAKIVDSIENNKYLKKLEKLNSEQQKEEILRNIPMFFEEAKNNERKLTPNFKELLEEYVKYKKGSKNYEELKEKYEKYTRN